MWADGAGSHKAKTCDRQPQLVRVRDEKQRAVSDDVGRVHESGDRGDGLCDSSARGGAGTATVTASGDGQAEEGHPNREASNTTSTCQPGRGASPGFELCTFRSAVGTGVCS